MSSHIALRAQLYGNFDQTKAMLEVHGSFLGFLYGPKLMKRAAQLYLLIVSIVGLGIFFILNAGSQLPSPVSRLSKEPAAATTLHSKDVSGSSFFASVQSTLQQNATNPLSRLFLQLLIIIVASGAVAWAFTRFGQTAVIGEMVAGILLG